MSRSSHEILKGLVEAFPEFNTPNDPNSAVNGADLTDYLAGIWAEIRQAVGLPPTAGEEIARRQDEVEQLDAESSARPRP
jgi:hypothetical protein